MKIEAVSPAVTTTLGSHACLLVIRVRTRYPHCHYLRQLRNQDMYARGRTTRSLKPGGRMGCAPHSPSTHALAARTESRVVSLVLAI